MMSSKTTVIYHRADFDGIFCREIARKFLPHADFIGWDYGDPVPDISSDKEVYMLDISIDGLMGHPNLIWIDHHKSAMEKFAPIIIRGYRIDGVAACRLAWQYFTLFHPTAGSFALPGKQDYIDRIVDEPLAVQLAGEYDIWDKRNTNAELFQHGLRSRDLGSSDWGQLLDNSIPENLKGTGMECTHSQLLCSALCERGWCVQYAKEKENESIIKAHGFTVQFEGLVFLACNHARFNSHLFTAGLKPEHDACLGYCYDGTQWKFSLYHAPGKEHHDLSLISAKYGGGGHRGACGFRCAEIPFIQ